MFVQMPYKKMKKIGTFGFTAQCDCGHRHKFKGTDYDLNKTNGSTAILKDVYTCPVCDTKYDGIFETIKDRNVWYKRTSPLGWLVSILIIGGLVFGGIKLITPLFNNDSTPTDLEHATNKQLQEFFNWDHQQQQQKRDNQPAFNSGN